MSSGEGRILFSFNGFLVEVQSLVKQENKSQAMLLFMNPGSHAEMFGGGLENVRCEPSKRTCSRGNLLIMTLDTKTPCVW